MQKGTLTHGLKRKKPQSACMQAYKGINFSSLIVETVESIDKMWCCLDCMDAEADLSLHHHT